MNKLKTQKNHFEVELEIHSCAYDNDIEKLKSIPENQTNIQATILLYTALHIAAETNSYEYAKELIVNRKAKLTIQDKYGNFVFHAAAKSGSLKILQLIQDQGVNIFQKNDLGDNILNIAIDFEQFELAKQIIQNYPKEKWDQENNLKQSPLFKAYEIQEREIYDLLTNKEAIHQKDISGIMPVRPE